MWQHVKNMEVEKSLMQAEWLAWLKYSERSVPEDEVEEIDRTRLCWTWRSYERAWNWLQEQWEASKIWKWGELWSLYLTDTLKCHTAAGWRMGWRMAYLVRGSLPKMWEAEWGGPSGRRSCVLGRSAVHGGRPWVLPLETRLGLPACQSHLWPLGFGGWQREQTEAGEFLCTCPVHLQTLLHHWGTVFIWITSVKWGWRLRGTNYCA